MQSEYFEMFFFFLVLRLLYTKMFDVFGFFVG